MERIKMTKEQFVEFINNIKGCQFVNVVAITDADMYLRNNPYRGRVKKFTVTPMQINYDYETAVNNRLRKIGEEPNFKADKLPFGTWLQGFENKIITYKDELYLRTYCVKNKHPKTFYLLDGVLVNDEQMTEIKQWLKPTSTSDKQSNAGLEKDYQVKPRTYKFESIIAITIKHTRIYLEVNGNGVLE